MTTYITMEICLPRALTGLCAYCDHHCAFVRACPSRRSCVLVTVHCIWFLHPISLFTMIIDGLNSGFMAVKRHREHSNSWERQHLIETACSFRSLDGKKCGSVRADMVLETELSFLHLGPQAAKERL